MPPKRSSKRHNGDEDPRSPKRPKTTPTSEPGSQKSPGGPANDDSLHAVPVSWALPTGDEKANERDRPLAETYAQALYSRALNQLNILPDPFGFPRIRTPIFRGYPSKSNVLKPDSHENRSGQPVCDLFEAIKNDTKPLKKGATRSAPAAYARIVFEDEFEKPNDPAVVASRSTAANRVLALTEDYWVQVTIHDDNDDDRTQSAQLHFIRKSPTTASTANAPATNHAFFIEVPADTRVTVNGTTYINDRSRGHGGGGGLPFIVGPLTRYTVIELLSQPIFFFRNRRDLDYTSPLNYKGLRARPSAEELENRTSNQDVTPGRVEIVWSTAQPSQAQSVQPTPPPPPPSPPPVPEPPSSPSSSEDEPVEYNDDFTSENGEEIAAVGTYIQNRLLRSFRGNTPLRAINTVLLGINDRQLPNTGFSIHLGDTVLRPGRPLFIPHEVHENYFVLLVFQATQDGHITLHVVDPRYWDSLREQRDSIVAHALELLRSTSWLTNVFQDEKDLAARLKPAQWVPCAQTSRLQCTSIYTILNAWALAMGLSLHSPFCVLGTPRHVFMYEARLLVRSVIDGVNQDWRIVLAFFRRWGYVQDYNSAMPPNDRRFDQSKRSFDKLLPRQRKEDREWRTSDGGVDLALVTGTVGLAFSNGGVYTEDFRADLQTKRYRDRLVVPLVNTGKWHPMMDDAQIRAAFAALAPPNGTATPDSNPAAAPGPTLPQTPRQPREDTSTQSTDISNPCAHLKESIQRLRTTDTHTWTLPIHEHITLSQEDVENSILAVLRAVNRRQPQRGRIDYIHQGQLVGDPSTSDPHDLCLFPRFHKSHTFLSVVQRASQDGGGVSIHVVDSAPWTFKTAERRKQHKAICETLESIDWIDEATGPSHTTWVFGARQIDPQHAPYYTVLNAWSIIFGMQLNADFRAQHGFFTLADEIIRAVIRGDADWSLIWAFLRCKKFATSEPLGPHYHFERTVPAGEEDQDSSSDGQIFELPEHAINYYDGFATMDSRMHHDDFVWESWKIEDIITRYPVVARACFQPPVDTHALRTVYEVFQEQPRASSETLGSDFNPCAHFRTEMTKALESSTIKDLLKKLREGGITSEIGAWLGDEEVSLAIASVTQAITAIQLPTGGFSAVSQPLVQQCFFEGVGQLSDPALRSGRPLLVPVVYNSHITLLIIQFGERGDPAISIMDSKAYYYTKTERDKIFQAARQLILTSRWWQHFIITAEEVKLPSRALWITGAHQPSDSQCGYYTIFNAWALALGLTPNIQFSPVWKSIFNDAKDLIHLARIGCADWKLIYAFLRCIRFVHEGDIPLSHRFTNTLKLESDATFVQYLKNARMEEERFWADRPDLTRNVSAIISQISIQLPFGHAHDLDFSSDRWGLTDRIQHARFLARIGRLRSSITPATLRQCSDTYQTSNHRFHHEAQGTGRAKRFLYWNIPANGAFGLKQLLSRYADNVLAPGAQRGNSERMVTRPCMVSAEGFAFLGHLINDTRVKSIIGELPIPSDWKQPLEPLEVNLAIASVVQALDHHQFRCFEERRNGSFKNGFSLATTTSVELARMEGSEASHWCHVSRPRRCWLLPLMVSSDDIYNYKSKKGENPEREDRVRAHIFLAVIQEETVEDTLEGESEPRVFQEFQIYVLDSARRIFQHEHAYIHQLVVDIAYKLGWAAYRNGPGSTRPVVKFANEVYFVEVPQQTSEYRNVCGYHTILNAWIVAMGLTPRRNTVLKNTLYMELHFLVRVAVAGLLDWQTLIAWLFCNRLVGEASKEVGQHRCFGVTEHQGNDEDKLDKYVREAHDTHDILWKDEEIDERESEYGSGSNWDYDLILDTMVVERFEKPTIPTVPDDALSRAYDDADLNFPIGSQRRRGVAEGVSVSRLSFLDDFEADGDVVMMDTMKSSRPVDVLSFLDAY